MTTPLDLTHFKDAIDKLQNDDSYNDIGKLNLAAWLGERAHFLVAEIERLREILKREPGTLKWTFVMESLAALYEAYCEDMNDCDSELELLIEAYDKWLG